jgi:hypothetical protein
MRIAAVLLVAFLAGCSSFQPKWTKEGSTTKDFDTAHGQCLAQSEERANVVAAHIVYAFYTGCMKAAGWTPPPAPKEEVQEEPKKLARMDAFKEEREKNAAAKHDAPAGETAKHGAPAAEPAKH